MPLLVKRKSTAQLVSRPAPQVKRWRLHTCPAMPLALHGLASKPLTPQVSLANVSGNVGLPPSMETTYHFWRMNMARAPSYHVKLYSVWML